jgi:hypothetical protein
MVEGPSWDDDIKMEYWNDGILGKIDFEPSSLSPLFHYSNNPSFHY